MKKKVFYTELSYVLGLCILALASALTEKADFGMSMVVAPAYILHLKFSAFWPWFSFGVAEYVFQGLLLLLTTAVMGRGKLSYLFSFVTALLYGTLLDGALYLVAALPATTLALRVLWYVVGITLCAFAVSLLFHTYLSPEAYELIVKELAGKTGRSIHTIKTIYDCLSAVLAVALSFVFFGFGVFRGVGVGTIVCALVNGFLISRFTKLLESRFVFQNSWKLARYFT